MKKFHPGLILCALLVGAYLFSSLPVGATSVAQDEEPPPQLLATQTEPVLTGLDRPLFVTHAGDGTNRLFIVERPGVIRVRQPGSNTSTVFLNITTLIRSSGSEQGLLGLAFHPDYETNRRFFVNYTRQSDGATVIAEYQASIGDPNVANTTEIPILSYAQPDTNHNGGMLAFGPDGFLYIASGDGGGSNDPGNRAQNINDLLGKILRIDIDTPNGPIPYSSPASNPFFGATPGADEIFAYGMRNPWRFSFDRGGSNQLFVGDVGQGAREEVDIIVNGGNYGWRIMEGSICNPNFNGGVCTPPAGHIPPITEYSSAPPSSRCSITGGYVYRGSRGSFPQGAYIFGDFCTGEVLQFFNGQQTVLLDTSFNISSFGEDEAGEIYLVHLGGAMNGSVQRLSNPDETIGVYRPSNQTFYLRNENTLGVAHTTIIYGAADDVPLVGDWDGNGSTTIGVYRPSNQTFFLRNSNSLGIADLVIPYGAMGDVPLVGDWDGDGDVTIGVYRPSNQTFYLRNANSIGNADLVIPYGAMGDVPLAGDWDGNGTTTLGVYRPSNQTFYLRNANSIGIADITVIYGANGDLPIVGDWDGNGTTTLGIRRPGEATFYLRNANSAGIADFVIPYGNSTDVPLAGNW